ncbi:MAG: kelch repeat-containing protein [Myxococcota bacterium]
MPLRALALAAVLQVSCFAGLDIESNAAIACVTQADCPDGRVCRTSIGLCVEESGDATVAPGLENTLVAPMLVAAGGRVDVEFQSTVTLARVPDLAAVQGDTVLPIDVNGLGDNRYRASFVFPEGSAEGVYQIRAEMIGVDGGVATGLVVGTTSLDATPPTVSNVEVSFLGATSNPLSDVELEAARPDSEIQVTVQGSEALGDVLAQSMTVSGVTERLSVVPQDTADPEVVRFSILIPAGSAPLTGEFSSELTLIDEAGNSEASPGPTLRFRAAAPELSVAQAALRFVRSPNGNSVSETLSAGGTIPAGAYSELAPNDSLDGSGAIGSGALAFSDAQVPLRRIRIWANAEASDLVGSLTPGADGEVPRSTFPSVPDRVWITGVDEAGNDSLPVALTQYEWVGTLNGTLGVNGPNALNALPLSDESLEFLVSDVVTSSDAVDGGDDEFATQSFAARFDERTSSAARPGPRSRASRSYDEARGALLLFGGATATGFSDELWQWDDRWARRTPAGPRPSNRAGAMMAYDGARGVSVLFGGDTGPGPSNDTWTWNGSQWREGTPAVSPPPRSDGALVYDPVRGETILFGGLDAQGQALGDTWRWDGFEWEELSAAGRLR